MAVMEVGGLSGDVFLLRVVEAMQSMAESRRTVTEALWTIFGVQEGTKPIRILQFMGMEVYIFINGLPIFKVRSLLLKPPYLQARKLSTDDSLDTLPVVEASISANDATLKDLEITMSVVREWASTQGSKFSEAVAVNNLVKWKTATQMTVLTILLTTRDARKPCKFWCGVALYFNMDFHLVSICVYEEDIESVVSIGIGVFSVWIHSDSNCHNSLQTESGVLTAYVSDCLKVPVILCKSVTDIVDGDKPAAEEFLQNLVAVTAALDEVATQVVDFTSGKRLSKL